MKKLIPLAVLLSISGLQLFAQEGKLKSVQSTSVWAPANIKVDGSLKEWDDTFQAYNTTTKIFYTMCNDDKYLYFVVKSIDVINNNKIIAGGITLTINTDDKKKEKGAYSLTFPNIPRPTRGQGGGGQRGGGGAGGGGGRGGAGGFGGGGDRQRGGAPDSATLAAQHKTTIEAAKEIKVLGFKDITDTLISIYNEFSMKSAIGYDKLGNYDYEMAIPLKALNLDPSNAKEFAYNVKVNGLTVPPQFNQQNGGGDNVRGGGAGGEGGGGAGGAGGGGGGGRGGRGGGGGGAPVQRPGGADGGRGNNNLEMFSPTDFWGKYTLAKK